MKKIIAMARKLNEEQLIELMKRTWNDSTGYMFREVAFDIIADRTSEEHADEVYLNVYTEMEYKRAWAR